MYILTYDISKDKTRRLVAKLVMEKGFYRLQKSFYIGRVSWKEVEEIVEYSSLIINDKDDSLYIFHQDVDNFKEGIFLGNRFDVELVEGSKAFHLF